MTRPPRDRSAVRLVPMTDPEINAAIAEACGWHKDESMDMWSAPGRDYVYEGKRPPNYVADLNAMHEAETILCQDEEDEDRWAECLRDICSTYGDSLAGNAKAMHATARQRAEAFLKTLGKWKA